MSLARELEAARAAVKAAQAAIRKGEAALADAQAEVARLAALDHTTRSPAATQRRAAVLGLLEGGPMRVREILARLEAAGMRPRSRQQMGQDLMRLVRLGRIRRVANGVYALQACSESQESAP